MANIQKDDVPTYVRELIEKEFKFDRVEEKDQIKNRSFYSREPRDGQHRPIYDSSYVKE